MINPYNELQKIMRSEGAALNPPTMVIGKVLSINPLHIVADGTPLFKNNLYINKTLLDYSCDVLLNSNNQDIDGNLTLKTILHEGSLVAMQATDDRQKYIVLCEVI